MNKPGSKSENKPANKLNWHRVEDFDRSEFPRGILKNMSADFMEQLFAFRKRLNAALIPSPLQEGWVRMDGSPGSQHYAVGRLSTAGDVFLAEGADARYAFTLACQFFNGVGIYYDTHINGKPRIMLHLDTREVPTVWCRHQGEYLYPARGGRDADVFYYLLGRNGKSA